MLSVEETNGMMTFMLMLQSTLVLLVMNVVYSLLILYLTSLMLIITIILTNYVQGSSVSDRYGVLIGFNKFVGLYVKQNGLCALIDSHHAFEKVGTVISISDRFTALVGDYTGVLQGQQHT